MVIDRSRCVATMLGKLCCHTKIKIPNNIIGNETILITTGATMDIKDLAEKMGIIDFGNDMFFIKDTDDFVSKLDNMSEEEVNNMTECLEKNGFDTKHLDCGRSGRKFLDFIVRFRNGTLDEDPENDDFEPLQADWLSQLLKEKELLNDELAELRAKEHKESLIAKNNELKNEIKALKEKLGYPKEK